MAEQVGAQPSNQPAQDDEAYLLKRKVPIYDHITAVRFHQRMHEELIYGRRQILVVIQLLFSRFRRSQMMNPQEYAAPIDDQGLKVDILGSEGLENADWHRGLRIGFDHIKDKIAAELNFDDPNQVDYLYLKKRQAKNLEVVVMGLDYLDKKVIDEGNQLFDAYINKCRKLIALMDEGLDRDIKKAAVDIWEDKLRQLTAQVKSVIGCRNRLLQIADDLINNKPNTEIDREEVHLILSLIYHRLFTAADRVPVVDFANVATKISGWDWRGQPKDEYDQIIWFPPPKRIVVILGEFGVLEREGEGAHDLDITAPNWVEPPNMRLDLNSDAFQYLLDLHRELIWGRRQILIVIQLIFGDFVPNRHIDQQKFVGPFEDDGSEFNLQQREDIDRRRWYNAISFALNFIQVKINTEDPSDSKYNYSKPTDHQKNAKYLELAAEGLKYLIQLTSKGLEKFQDYVAECQTVLEALKTGPERNDKKNKVDKFAQKFLDFSDQIEKLLDLREELLETAKSLLDEPATVDLKMVRNNLSGIYFVLYPIPGQLPMKEFVDVTYAIFGWNWTIELLPDQSKHLTWFQKPDRDVQIRGSLGVLMERRGPPGAVGGPLGAVGGPPGAVGGPPEAVGGPSAQRQGEEAPGKTLYSVFRYLRRMNEELIYARRQILVVIELFHRKINPQQKYTWPIKDDGEGFHLWTKEGLNLHVWEKGIKAGTDFINNMLREEQDEPGQMPASELTNEYREMAKYLEVAVVGLDYLVGQKPNRDEVFNKYLPHCQAKIRALDERSPERKMKQEALYTLVEGINELAAHIRGVRDQYKNRLLEMAEKLFEQSEVDSNAALDVLSRIYYQFHPLAEQVPMTEFVNVAEKIDGWNFNSSRTKDKKGKWTWFERAKFIVSMKGELGVLWDRIKERRAQGGGGAQS